MNKLQMLDALLFFCEVDWFGRPKFKPFRDARLKMPRPSDITTYVTLGSQQAGANGIDVGTIEKALEYLCEFCQYYNSLVCPHLPKP